jgi:orotate phosphoribosyltransferase-like protein
MKENWLLFAIALMADEPVTVEGAMELYQKGKVNTCNAKNILNYSADIAEWHENGMSLKEIADLLGISKNAVTSRIVRYNRRVAV